MKLPVRLIVVVVLAGCLLVPWRPARVLAVLDLLLFLPAWALASRSRVSLVPALGLASALSPVLFGAAVLLAMAMGVQPYGAAWASVVVWAAVFLAGGGGAVAFNRAEVRIARALFAVTAVAGVLALTLPIADEWWRLREDSWFHAAVLQHIIHHGVPPADPYFTPLRLQYMYYYHAILAGVSALTSLDPFYCMVLVNGAALVGCVFGFGYLSSFFSRRVWPRALGAALLLFGMNGFFYLFYPIRVARALTGESSGLAMLAHFFPWSPAGHATATRLLSVENNQFFMLDKFMLGTALSLSLGLVCVVVALLVSARRGHWTRAHSVAFVAALAGSMMLHSVIGVTVMVATLVLFAVLMLIRSHTGDGAPSYAALTVLVLVALAVGAPFVYSVMPRGGGAQPLGLALQPGHALGLFSCILPALVLSVPFLRWMGTDGEWRRLNAAPDTDTGEPRDQTPPPPGGILTGRLFGELSLSGAGVVATWTLIVLAVALVADLPTNNETKFAFLLFLPLAAFATGGINRMWDTRGGRAAAVVVVAAATLPLNGVYFYHAFNDGSTFDVARDERAAYAFVERGTPADAVFIDSDDIVRIPVLGARDLYWGNETYAFNWSYPTEEIRRRREIRDAVYDGSLRTRHVDTLRALDRPVYVMVRGAQFDRFSLFQEMNENPFYTGRFLAGEYAVFQMRFDAPADSAATAP